MHYEILDARRQGLLPQLAMFKQQFYLAGGTGLALQLGHRESIDFDFFTGNDFAPSVLFTELCEAFRDKKVEKTQEENNTLTIIVEGVSVSFFTYRYPLVSEVIEEPMLRVASVRDIGCMKLSAITSRSLFKDFIDLYFILQLHPLRELLANAASVTPTLNQAVILKSLVYFEDIREEPVVFCPGKQISLTTIQKYLQEQVRSYMNQ